MKIPKPPSCFECPFYSRSKYFVPDTIHDTSPILIMAQNPGELEVKGEKITRYRWSGGRRYNETIAVSPQPLIGGTGYQIATQYWPQTGLGSEHPWESVSKANVIKCRVDDKNELPNLTLNDTRNAILHCTQHHLKLPEKVRYILSLGQTSLWYTTRQNKLEDWRGSALPYGLDHDHTMFKPRPVPFYFDQSDPRWSTTPVVFIAMHPASLYKGDFDADAPSHSGGNKRFHHATYSDFRRFGQLVQGIWPTALPDIRYNELPDTWPDYSAFDTEYDVFDNNRVYMFSLSDREGSSYVVDDSNLLKQRTAIHPGSTLVMQNLLADVSYLPHLIDPRMIKVIEDTMFAHSVLWTGEPHNLNYILSIMGKFNRHKHLGIQHRVGEPMTDNQILYAGLDAYTTLHHAWKQMLKEFKDDPRSWAIYREYRLPLAYLIGSSQQQGVRINRQRLEMIETLHLQEIAGLQDQARLLTGNDQFNLGSVAQLAARLYQEDEDAL